ncbi:MAG: hypothetical protein OJF49_003960 [Ktedonobacterales bacterium]|nr:MAG: hypothetical protein OJF49_003960 [Ktedonobacterales bacterium]
MPSGPRVLALASGRDAGHEAKRKGRAGCQHALPSALAETKGNKVDRAPQPPWGQRL